jgi:hypothetical protein
MESGPKTSRRANAKRQRVREVVKKRRQYLDDPWFRSATYAAISVAILAALICVVLIVAANAAEFDCEAEVRAYCVAYPGPRDTDCDRLAADECRHAPLRPAELCMLRAKRLCIGAGPEYGECVAYHLRRCKVRV